MAILEMCVDCSMVLLVRSGRKAGRAAFFCCSPQKPQRLALFLYKWVALKLPTTDGGDKLGMILDSLTLA